jgi:hypothetical protein
MQDSSPEPSSMDYSLHTTKDWALRKVSKMGSCEDGKGWMELGPYIKVDFTFSKMFFRRIIQISCTE